MLSSLSSFCFIDRPGEPVWPQNIDTRMNVQLWACVYVFIYACVCVRKRENMCARVLCNLNINWINTCVQYRRTDWVCASEGDNLCVHVHYPRENTNMAGEFFVLAPLKSAK